MNKRDVMQLKFSPIITGICLIASWLQAATKLARLLQYNAALKIVNNH